MKNAKMVTCHHCGKRKAEGMNGYCQACLSLSCGDLDTIVELKGRRRCIVKDCSNHTDQGLFVGDFCSPCHAFVAKGEGRYSQAYRNNLRYFAVELSNAVIRRLDPTCRTPSIADQDLLRLIRG